jgi:hypothetical protein
VRGVERHRGPAESREVQAGTAPGVKSRHALGDRPPERLGSLDEPGGSRVPPLDCSLLVDVDGAAIHVPLPRDGRRVNSDE